MPHNRQNSSEFDDLLDELFAAEEIGRPNLENATNFTQAIVTKLTRRRRIRRIVLALAVVLGGVIATQALLPIVAWIPALTQLSLTASTMAVIGGLSAIGTWLFSLLWQQY